MVNIFKKVYLFKQMNRRGRKIILTALNNEVGSIISKPHFSPVNVGAPATIPAVGNVMRQTNFSGGDG